MSLFGKKYRFSEEKLEVSTKILNNPACGWYQIHTFYVEKEPDMEELRWCISPEDQMALLIFHIGAYRDKELDQPALANMDAVLSFFVKKEKDLIVRIVYDNEGKGLEREPMNFSQVLSHVDKLGAVLEKYTDRIFIFQGLLLGSWGEMHGSKFLAKYNLIEMKQKLKSYLWDDTFLAVRRPMFYRQLFSSVSSANKMGIYDDGMFASGTHLGTFGENSKVEAGWEEAWNRKEELDFLDELGIDAPNGGEVVMSEDGVYPYDLKETVSLLRKMHISYLNRVHDLRVLDEWKSMKWREKDIWNDCDGYHYIAAHLGYRFRILSTKVRVGKDDWKLPKADICVRIQNDGFSNCYQATNVFLEIDDKRYSFITDIRKCNSGEELELNITVPLRKGNIPVYIGMERAFDKRVMYFANDLAEDGKVLLGMIV